MALYGVQVVGWLLSGALVVLGALTAWHVWGQWRLAWQPGKRNRQPGGQPGEPVGYPTWPASQPGSLSQRDLRYLRWRTGLRLATGILLIGCGVLLGYLGTWPLSHLEGLFQELTRDQTAVPELQAAEHGARLWQTLFWVAVLGLGALLLIALALAELTITWLYSWHQRWELHQAHQAYLAQQAAAAQAQRSEPVPPSQPTVPQQD